MHKQKYKVIIVKECVTCLTDYTCIPDDSRIFQASSLRYIYISSKSLRFSRDSGWMKKKKKRWRRKKKEVPRASRRFSIRIDRSTERGRFFHALNRAIVLPGSTSIALRPCAPRLKNFDVGLMELETPDGSSPRCGSAFLFLLSFHVRIARRNKKRKKVSVPPFDGDRFRSIRGRIDPAVNIARKKCQSGLTAVNCRWHASHSYEFLSIYTGACNVCCGLRRENRIEPRQTNDKTPVASE